MKREYGLFLFVLVAVLPVILLAAVLFVAAGGVQLVWATLQETFIGLVEQGAAANVDPRSLLIAGGVLLFLAYRKIASLA